MDVTVIDENLMLDDYDELAHDVVTGKSAAAADHDVTDAKASDNFRAGNETTLAILLLTSSMKLMILWADNNKVDSLTDINEDFLTVGSPDFMILKVTISLKWIIS